MLNFAHTHFVNNTSEYFVVIGHQISEFIVKSYLLNINVELSSKATRCHVTSELSPKIGSQNFLQDISTVTQFSTNVFFMKTSTGLYTSRYQRQSFLIFISELFGTLSGLIGFIRIFMCQFEDWSKKKETCGLEIEN